MTFTELLNTLSSLGITVRRRKEELVVHAPNDVMTPDLAKSISQYKSELLVTVDNHDGRQTDDLIPVGRTQNQFPVSFEQQRLWLLDRLSQGEAGYLYPTVLNIHGELNIDALRRSFRRLFDRHEVLRTYFVSENGVPFQKIEDNCPLPFIVVDIESVPSDKQDSLVKRLFFEQIETGFKLDQAPLVRVMLIRMSDDKHMLNVMLHHIITDFWSVGVMTQELINTYQDIVQGRSPDLTELPVQYVDYAQWQRNRLKGAYLDKLERFWVDYLAGFSPGSTIPTDSPRPNETRYSAAQQIFEIPQNLVRWLDQFSKNEEITVSTIFLAVFAILIHRYTGDDDIAIGMPVAGRTHHKIEPLIGFFVNTLTMRIRLQGDQPVLSLFKSLREDVIKALQHQDYPFDLLVRKLMKQRVQRHNPMFDAMFICNKGNDRTEADLDLKITPAEGLGGYSEIRSNIDFYVYEHSNQIIGKFVYNKDLYQSTGIDRLIRRLLNLLSSLSLDPHQRISSPEVEKVPKLPAIAAGNNDQQTFPLSYHQERIYFIDQFENGNVYPHAPTYHNVMLGVSLDERIDPELLQWAFEQLVQRYPIFFPVISRTPDGLVQQFSPDVDFRLETVSCDEGTTWEEVISKAEANSQTPFELGKELLLRGALYQIDRLSGCFLAISAHHYIVDHYTLENLVVELKELVRLKMENRAVGNHSKLERYQDAIVAQQSFPDDLTEAWLFYWRYQLRNITTAHLPMTKQRPKIHIYQPAKLEISLDSLLSSRIGAFTAGTDWCPKEVFLCAYLLVLKKYTAENGITLGTYSEKHADIGPFANLWVLNFDLTRCRTVYDVLTLVRTTHSKAIEHGGIPFDFLVSTLNLEKDMSRTALFDILFQYHDSLEAFEFGNATAEIRPSNLGLGKYDLNLAVYSHRDRIDAKLTYNALYFDTNQMVRMKDHLLTTLEEVCRDENQRIRSLVMVKQDEFETLPSDVTNTFPSDQTVHELFSRMVAENPDRIAIVHEDHHITYGELEKRSNQLAWYLIDHGVKPDQLVALFLDRSISYVIAILGVLKAGSAYLPLEPDAPKERVSTIIREADASFIITDDECSAVLPAEAVTPINLSSVKSRLSRQWDYAPDRKVSRDNLIYCIFTSGSTGIPKGVMLTHHNVIQLISGAKPVPFDENDIWTVYHSFVFDFSVWELFGPLLTSGKAVLIPRSTAQDQTLFHRVLLKNNVSILCQTPSAFYSLSNSNQKNEKPLSKLRMIIFGGEKLDVGRLQDWMALYPDQTMVNMYGITETTVHTTVKKLSQKDVERGQSTIGSALATLRTYILDDDLNLVPKGVTGELFVSGHGLARGYLNRPDVTAERFIPNPFSDQPGACMYRTGDRCRYLENGETEYIDRSDHQVKLRGFRIELGEIESALSEHPGVRESAVFLETPEQGMPYLKACFTSDGTQALTQKALHQFLSNRLPSYMVPLKFEGLTGFPRTSGGKIDRTRLNRMTGNTAQNDDNESVERDQIDGLLINIWENILEASNIGIRDNFFELGGHSLLATQLVSRVYDTFQVRVSLSDFFEAPTILHLRELITEGDSSSGTPLTKTSRDDNIPLSFAQQRLWVLNMISERKNLHHVPMKIRVTGKLDRRILEESFRALIQRHEILRTGIRLVDGKPWQVISDRIDFKIRYSDISQLPSDKQQDIIDGLEQEIADEPFDLTQFHLFRVALATLDENQHLVLLCMHHIVTDGWSQGILARELTTIYQALSQGEAPALPTLDIQYGDYAAWQQASWEKGDYRNTLDFWNQYLEGCPTVLELPFDNPRSSINRNRGAIHDFFIPAETTKRANETAKAHDCTLFIYLLAVFGGILNRFSGQSDFIIGTDVACRTKTEIESLIGFFINQLPIRISIDSKQSFQQVVKAVRESVLKAFNHQDVPFDRIVSSMKLERNPAVAPLFQVKLVLQNFPEEEIVLNDLSLTTEPMKNAVTAEFDLLLTFYETGNGLHGVIHYNKDLFHPSKIQRFAQNYVALLQSVVEADPCGSV